MYPKDMIRVNFRFFPRSVFVSQAELELQKSILTSQLFLNCTCKRNWFCNFKKDFNQFSLESKEYHGHSVSKMSSLLFVVIVLYLKFKPDSVQIGSADKS